MVQFLKNYFDQEQLWDREPSPYQQAVLTTLSHLFYQSKISSLLELGPGSGFTGGLYRQIPLTCFLDISLSALKQANFHNSIQASAECLPFLDKSFSQLVANDVLEHIPDTFYVNAINELARISSGSILITNPLAEDLLFYLTKCESCCKIFHINHHQRRYIPGDYLSLFPKPWKLNRIVYTGTFRPARSMEGTIELRTRGSFRADKNAYCPKCGASGGGIGRQPSDSELREIETTEFYRLMGNQRFWDGYRIDNSEVTAEFITGNSILGKLPACPISEAIKNARKVNHSAIDFSLADAFYSQFMPPNKTSPYFIVRDARHAFEDHALKVTPNLGAHSGRVVCVFPPLGQAHKTIMDGVEIRGETLGNGEIIVRFQKPDSLSWEILKREKVNGQFNLLLECSIPIVPRWGVVVRIESKSVAFRLFNVSVVPHSCTNLNVARKQQETPFVSVLSSNIEIYYQPTNNGKWFLLPNSLASDPLMSSENEDWQFAFRELTAEECDNS